jgi:hypothetical protein
MEFGKVGIAAFAARPERADEIFADFASRVAASAPSPSPVRA